MTMAQVRLSDRTDLAVGDVLLSGTQALVRLVLMQGARDRAAGLRTAGYVTGYRGSPLGGVDTAMERAAEALRAADIRFQAALNEDLAATALWGRAGGRGAGEGRFDGVFGLWYGKGRGWTGRAMPSGTGTWRAPRATAGWCWRWAMTIPRKLDTVHQSEFAAVDAQMPILSPAGVQEILDFGLHGYELSRFSGLWVALKLPKDTVESTAVVDGRPGRVRVCAACD